VRLRSFFQNEEGAAMVEFAIVSVIFLLLLLGIGEFGRAAWIKNSITAGARDGARYASVRGSTSGRVADSAGVASFVESTIRVSPIRVVPSWPTGKDPGDVVQVTVKYAYSPIIGFPFADTLRSVSKMVIVF
jgi:Flp pilus assembly pilin Flp